ncbi:unnamed protein product [Gongylonema pulchrum]|uniref:WH2 domain-containing protein n=1 Tax=Gongylonema pulchrum TaxID=637853 RepID=A0A183ESI0_9BILA|nr:unnamed protein product [Gongylonema pulchrum]
MNEPTAAQDKEVASHRGFSQKARGVLLESHSVTSDKLPNIPDKNGKDGQTAAPHRGFNEKAREVLLDRKTPGKPLPNP